MEGASQILVCSLCSSQLYSARLVLRNYAKDTAFIHSLYKVFSPLYRNQLGESETHTHPFQKEKGIYISHHTETSGHM